MKTISALILCLSLCSMVSYSQNLKWARGFGSALNGGFNDGIDQGFSTAADGSGNVYVMGEFRGVADFDPSAGVTNLTSHGRSDIFVAKYDISGNFLWAIGMGGTDADYGYGIATDSSGNVVITGSFFNTADFDPGSGTTNLTSAGNMDIYVAKYDASGNFLWANNFGYSATDQGKSVVLDANANVYVTGDFQYTVDFDPSTATANLVSAGNSDVFLAKFDPSGNYLWARNIAGTSSDLGNSIALDDSNNAYVTGIFRSTADFDPSLATANLTSAGINDVFLAKYDASGNYVWANAIGGVSWDDAHSVAIDGSNNVYLAGSFTDSADFDPSANTAKLISSGGYDGYLAKYDASGNYLWAKKMGGPSTDEANSVAVDANDNPHVTGYFRGTAGFDSSQTNQAFITSSGNTEIFLAKYNDSGNYLWGKGIGSSSYERSYAITIDENNHAYITGYFIDSADFDPSPQATAVLNSAGSRDVFLAKYGACTETMNTIGITSCDSLLSPSGTYTWYSSGTFSDTLINAEGCDSVITINATINSSHTGTDVVTACDSYTWIDGNTYTSDNNSATFTLSNAYGCDSVVTLNLTILSSSSGTDILTACDSYTWIDGVTYTGNNNSATHILTNTQGCDSVVTLDLTINNSSTGTDVRTACDAFTWIDGNTYTSSNNTATHTLINSVGCDSVVTLDLTINNSNSGTDVLTACDSFTWIDGNTYTSSNNTATHTMTNSAGCDSVVTLDLTIHNSSTGTDVVTACDSYTWIDGITYTSSNNTATHLMTNAMGCDSVVTLDLTLSTVDTAVSRSGITLTASASATAYQWLDCNNNYAELNGETNRDFTATNDGSYAVEVTANGCIDTSSCHSISNVSVEENRYDTHLKLYPNPNTGSFTVELKALTGDHYDLEVWDMTGKLIERYPDLYTDKAYTIELSKMEAGVYYIRITGSHNINRQLIVE